MHRHVGYEYSHLTGCIVRDNNSDNPCRFFIAIFQHLAPRGSDVKMCYHDAEQPLGYKKAKKTNKSYHYHFAKIRVKTSFPRDLLSMAKTTPNNPGTQAKALKVLTPKDPEGLAAPLAPSQGSGEPRMGQAPQ